MIEHSLILTSMIFLYLILGGHCSPSFKLKSYKTSLEVKAMRECLWPIAILEAVFSLAWFEQYTVFVFNKMMLCDIFFDHLDWWNNLVIHSLNLDQFLLLTFFKYEPSVRSVTPCTAYCGSGKKYRQFLIVRY